MEDLKQLVEDFIEYTKTWSISETEWFYNVDSSRKNAYGKDYITHEEFERAVREEILYCFIYKINSIKQQMENDICNYYEEETSFHNASIDMEKKIQKIFKDFKICRD